MSYYNPSFDEQKKPTQSASSAPQGIFSLALESLKTIRQFRDILERESQALNEFNFIQAADLHADKTRLSQEYAQMMEKLLANNTHLRDLPDTIKESFKNERDLFDDACRENKKALQKGGAIAKRLSERIIKITKSTLNEKSLTYSPYGTTRGNSSKPVYIQYNETL